MLTLRHGITNRQEGFVLLRTLIFTAVMLLICCSIMSSVSFLIKRVAIQQETAAELISRQNKRVNNALN